MTKFVSIKLARASSILFIVLALFSESLLGQQDLQGIVYSSNSNPYQKALEAWNKGENVTKIIGGRAAIPAQIPWQAGLLVSSIDDPVSAHFCGGTILTEKWIVTAAHCVGERNSSDFDIVAGVTNLADVTSRFKVDEIHVHKEFVHEVQGNDIALLKLADSLTFTQFVSPIDYLRDDSSFNSSTVFTISGWGNTANSSGSKSMTLQFIDSLPFVSRETCNEPLAYFGLVKIDMLCSGLTVGGRDSCAGDSGGPHVVVVSNEPMLSGIVSWGQINGCAKPYKYGVYTRVSYFSDWIQECLISSDSCYSKP